MTWVWALFKARSAFAWITASAARLLLAGCVILGLWGVYQRGQAHKWHNIAGERLAALERLQIAADKAKAQSTAIAKDNTDEHETRLTGDLDLARNYARNNRVQVCAKPAASGEGAYPGVPVAAAPVPELAVAVSEQDIDACTRAYGQALGAADYLGALVDAGLGEVAK